MIQLVHKGLAIVSACGLLAGLVVYIASYRGATIDAIARWAIALHVGVFTLLLPMYAVEYSQVRQRTFFWRGFGRNMPKWVISAIKLLGLFFVVHFVLFLAESHASSPELKDGQYVLDDHGTTIRTLTRAQYYSLKGAELRLFATGWMFFYLVPTAYWWYLRAA